MKFRHSALIAAIGLISIAMASPALAQSDIRAENPEGPACELHVWPAERFQATTMGLLAGFGGLGGLADAAAHASNDQSNKAQIATALDSQGQTEALASLDLTTALKLQPSRIVLHDKPLDRKTVNKIMERRAESTSPCYAELIVADVFYLKTAIYGRTLKALFILRRFGTKPTSPAIYKGWGGNGLKLFPPKDGEDFQAAANELTNVFKADFMEFAKNAAAGSAK